MGETPSIEELQREFQAFKEKVEASLWAAEIMATVLTMVGGPLRKAIEIAIGGAILYLMTHIRLAP